MLTRRAALLAAAGGLIVGEGGGSAMARDDRLEQRKRRGSAMVRPVDPVKGCPICEGIERLEPDRIVLQSQHWIASTMLDVPGWILVSCLRHAEGSWSLADSEAESLGPVLRDLSRAMKAVSGAERIHLAAQGENAPHFHYSLIPRLPGGTPIFKSQDLIARATQEADPVRALDVEQALLHALGKQ